VDTDKKEALLGLARNDEEKIFIARCLDHIGVAQRNKFLATAFLDPGQVSMMEAVCQARGGLRLLTWGGYRQAERRRALLVPDENDWYEPDFQIAILAVTSLDGETPGHRDFLGSLVGLGLSRDKLGDIGLQEKGATVFVASEISAYICQSLVRVGRHPVSVLAIDPADFVYTPQAMTEKGVTLASPRLDALISKAFNLARSDAAELVAQGRVHQNWRQQLNISAPVRAGDVISCRGYGRFYLLENPGSTKKGRDRFVLGFPVENN
jgi:RNA-binding protein YlmH